MTTPPARRLSSRELGALDLTLHDPRIVWAKSARASSSWSDSYGPSTACGPPSVFPEHGDRAGTWLAGSGDRRPWIELEMPALEHAHAVLICETCGAGGITSVRDQDNALDLYEAKGKATQTLSGARLLVVPLDPQLRAPSRIRIGLKPGSSEYQEIDAVALVTVPFDELMSTPAHVSDLRHERLAPSEVQIHDLKGDRRIAWANHALASSEYSSSYSARAAIGRPNVFPRGGDHDRTWLSDNADRNAWIEVSFDAPPRDYGDCHGFLVFETCGAGCVVRASDEKGRTLWQAAMESVPERQARMLHVPLPPGPPPKKLRLHVSPAVSDYREIDAVALLYAPLAELRTEAPPPPPPPIPGAPPEGFTFLEGTLLGVSAAQPLVHAVISSAEGGRAVTWGPALRLEVRKGKGHETFGSAVDLELGETTVFGDPLPSRRGRFSDVAAALPMLPAHAHAAADADVVIRGQQITREVRVYVAGIPEGGSEGGFRESAGTPDRLRVAAISLEPLSATPFLRDGTETFDARAKKLVVPERLPHPLGRWTTNALRVAGLAIAGALAALLLTLDGATGGPAAMLGLALSFALGATIFAVELLGRMHLAFVVGKARGAKRNGRVGFTSPGWTLTGVILTAGIAAGLASLVLGTTDGDAQRAAWASTTILAGGYALVRALMWQWTAGPALFTALRALLGPATTGALVSEHRSSERLTAHSEYLGSEQRTDDQGRVTTHDRYRNWNTRSARADHRITIALPDGTRMSPAAVAAVIDVGMRATEIPAPAVGRAEVPYAAFASEHEVGDVASLVGRVEVDGDERKVANAIVVLGPRATLIRKTALAAACLLVLWGIAIAGITTLAVGLAEM